MTADLTATTGDQVSCPCGATVTLPPRGTVTECPDSGHQFMLHHSSGWSILTPEHAAQIRNPRWTPQRQGDYNTVTVTYYAGSAQIYYPITDPAHEMYGGSNYITLTCDHKHTSPAAARKCGTRLAAREARARNAQNGA